MTRSYLVFTLLLIPIAGISQVKAQSPPNQAPTAVISTQPPTGYEDYHTGTTIYFDATQSSDPDGDQLNYEWDFGDDVFVPDASRIGGASIPIILRGMRPTTPIVNHTFPFAVDNDPQTQNPESYTVTLTVSDGRLSDATSMTVTPVYEDFTVPTTHPFLMVTQADYPGIRQLAGSQEPFSTIKTNAENKSAEFIAPDDSRYWFDAARRVGASGLAYILNPSNEAEYQARILKQIKDGVVRGDGGPEAILTDPNDPDYPYDETLLDGDIDKITCGFSDAVGLGAYIVNLLGSYDLIYDQLPSTDTEYINPLLNDIIADMTICNVKEWNTYGVNAIWNLFRASTESDATAKSAALYRFQRFKNLYMQAMERYSVTDDGIINAGTGYGRVRYNWIREGKYALINIAEHTKTGIFYQDPRYQGMYEWFWGYAMTPMETGYMYGDSSSGFLVSKFFTHDSPGPVQTYQFSDQAAQHSRWRWRNHVNETGGGYKGYEVFEPNLQSFVLMTKNLDQTTPDYFDFTATSQAQSPPSRIFPDGGAYFQENNLTYESLSGAMYNATTRVWHTHNETNGLLLNAYGEHLLLGSGYYGQNADYGHFPFDTMNHFAHTNNTVLIDNIEHVRGDPSGIGNGGDWWANNTDLPGFHETVSDTQYGQNHNALQGRGPYSKRGDGIKEGFANHSLDYASGDTGEIDWSYHHDSRDESVFDVIKAAHRVIPNGRHIRNFVFIHPQDGQNGYFVTLDEVEAYTLDGTVYGTKPVQTGSDLELYELELGCQSQYAYPYSMSGQDFTKCDLPGTTSPKTDAVINLYFHPNTDSLIPRKGKTFFYTLNGTLRNEADETAYPAHHSSGSPNFSSGSHLDPQNAMDYTQSLTLDGSEYLTVSNSSALSFDTRDYTASVWFKSTQNTPATLLAKGAANQDGYNAKLFINPDGQLATTVTTNNAGAITHTTLEDTNGTVSVADGAWHNLTVSVDVKGTSPDYTTTIELYADGQLLTDTTVSGHLHSNTSLWTIGAELDTTGNPANYFAGTLDYVKLFDRRQSDQVITNIMSVSENGGPLLVTPNTEYAWNMSGYDPNNNAWDAKLNIALGAPPASIQFPWSHIAGNTQLGHHLKANFNTDSLGKANIPTVLYPSDTTHTKPTITRIATADYHGLVIGDGSFPLDYVVTVPFDQPTAVQNIADTQVDLDARSTIFRRDNTGFGFYFVRQGNKLIDTITGIGFQTTSPTSLHLNDTHGSIISPGTQLTIYDYDITGVTLDGNPLTITASDPGTDTSAGYATVYVPRGTWELSYTNNGQPPVIPSPTPIPKGDRDSDGDIDYLDYTTTLQSFGSIYPIYDVNDVIANYGQ